MEVERVDLRVFDDLEKLKKDEILQDISSKFKEIENCARPKRDAVNFVVKGLQSICQLKLFPNGITKDPKIKEKPSIALNCALDGLSAMQSLCKKGVKTDESNLVARVISFSSENGYIEEGLKLTGYFFYLISEEQPLRYGDYSAKSTWNELNRTHEESMMRLPIDSGMNKAMFVLFSRIKLLARLDDKYFDFKEYSKNLELAKKGLEEQKCRNNNVNISGWKEYSILRHRGYLRNTRERNEESSLKMSSFYSSIFNDKIVSSDQIGAMLLEILNSQKQQLTDDSERYFLQLTVVNTLQIILETSHKEKSSNIMKELFESTNLNGTLEVLALVIEDEKLIANLGCMFNNEGRIGVLFRSFGLVKSYENSNEKDINNLSYLEDFSRNHSNSTQKLNSSTYVKHQRDYLQKQIQEIIATLQKLSSNNIKGVEKILSTRLFNLIQKLQRQDIMQIDAKEVLKIIENEDKNVRKDEYSAMIIASDHALLLLLQNEAINILDQQNNKQTISKQTEFNGAELKAHNYFTLLTSSLLDTSNQSLNDNSIEFVTLKTTFIQDQVPASQISSTQYLAKQCLDEAQLSYSEGLYENFVSYLIRASVGLAKQARIQENQIDKSQEVISALMESIEFIIIQNSSGKEKEKLEKAKKYLIIAKNLLLNVVIAFKDIDLIRQGFQQSKETIGRRTLNILVKTERMSHCQEGLECLAIIGVAYIKVDGITDALRKAKETVLSGNIKKQLEFIQITMEVLCRQVIGSKKQSSSKSSWECIQQVFEELCDSVVKMLRWNEQNIIDQLQILVLYLEFSEFSISVLEDMYEGSQKDSRNSKESLKEAIGSSKKTFEENQQDVLDDYGMVEQEKKDIIETEQKLRKGQKNRKNTKFKEEDDDEEASKQSYSQHRIKLVQGIRVIRRLTVQNFEQFHSAESVDLSDTLAFNRVLLQILLRLAKLLKANISRQTKENTNISEKATQTLVPASQEIILHSAIVSKITHLLYETRITETSQLSNLSDSKPVYEGGAYYSQAVGHLLELSDHYRIYLDLFAPAKSWKPQFSQNFITNSILVQYNTSGSHLPIIFKQFTEFGQADLRQLCVSLHAIKENSLYFGIYELSSRVDILLVIILQFLIYTHRVDSFQDDSLQTNGFSISASKANLNENITQNQSYSDSQFDPLDCKEQTLTYYFLTLQIEECLESLVSSFQQMGLLEESRKLQEYSKTHSCIEEVGFFVKNAKRRGIVNKERKKTDSLKQLKHLKCLVDEIILKRAENGCLEASSSRCSPHLRELLKLADKIEVKTSKAQIRSSRDGWGVIELDYLLMSQRIHLLCGQKAKEMNAGEVAVVFVEKAFKKLTALTFVKAAGTLTEIFSKQAQNSKLFQNSSVTQNLSTQTSMKAWQTQKTQSSKIQTCTSISSEEKISIDCTQLLGNFKKIRGKCLQGILTKSLVTLCELYKSQDTLTDLRYYARILITASERFLQFENSLKGHTLLVHSDSPEQTVFVDLIQNLFINTTNGQNYSLNLTGNNGSSISSTLASLFDRRKSLSRQQSISWLIGKLKEKLPQIFKGCTSQTEIAKQAVPFLVSLFASQIKSDSDRQLETSVCMLIHLKAPLFKLNNNLSKSQNQQCHMFSLLLNLHPYITDISQNNSSKNMFLLAHEYFPQHTLSHSNSKSFYLRYPLLVQSLHLLESVAKIINPNNNVDNQPLEESVKSNLFTPKQAKTHKPTIQINSGSDINTQQIVGIAVALINLRELCRFSAFSFLPYDLSNFRELSYLYQKHDETLKDLIREHQYILKEFKNLTYFLPCECFPSVQEPVKLLNSAEDAFIFQSFAMDYPYTHKQLFAAAQKQILNDQSIASSRKEKQQLFEYPELEDINNNEVSQNSQDEIQNEMRKVRESLREFSISKYSKSAVSRGMAKCFRKSRIDSFTKRKESLERLGLLHDVVLVDFEDFNNERILVITKRNWISKKYSIFRIASQTKANLFADYIRDIKKILQSNESEMRQEEKKRKSQVDSSAWWKTRFSYDKQLGKILLQTAAIFDYNIFLFFGSENEKRERDILNSIEKAIQQAANGVDIIGNSWGRLNLEQERDNLIEMLFSLVKCSFFMKLTDKKFKIIFELLSLQNLFLFCIEQEAQQELFENIMTIKEKYIKGYEQSLKKPMIWMLSANLQQVPLEYIGCFPENSQFFYRIPSIEYLCDNYKTDHKVNFSNLYYMLNPSGDLIHTQSKFQQKFESIRSWEGTSGFSSSSTELQQVLREYEVYQYIGHGGGELYLTPKQIQEIGDIKSAVLLFGCQSAKQVFQLDPLSTVYETTGTSLYFLLSKCKLVVGSLWDVTDRDTDKIVFKLIKLFQKAQVDSPLDFVQAFLQAREECSLKQLNGSSFIAYGIPTFFYSNN